MTSFAGCGSEGKVAQMNRWGFDECRANFETISGWINDAHTKASWSRDDHCRGHSVTRGLARLDPLAIAGSLVHLAIERSESGRRQCWRDSPH
jgi:hypothetical protein